MKKLTALLLTLALTVTCAVPAAASGIRDALGSWGESLMRDSTWAIYWYLCGSDLETEGGYATADLEEVMSVTLPENVTMVIQTGGAKQWQWKEIPSDKLGRFVYKGSEMRRVANLPQASMGDPDTLADFLTFCRTEYPADRTMLILWGPGTGSCGGVCYDRNFGDDCLTIPEIGAALSKAMKPSSWFPPMEFIGFDTGMSASIDLAAALQGYTRYMIASENIESAPGWDYRGVLTKLSADAGMDSQSFGRILCDSYYEACADQSLGAEATISLLDVGKLDVLLDAYEKFGREAGKCGKAEGNVFYSAFSRGACRADHYGGNTPSSGFFDMADLADLAEQNRSILPDSAEEVINAVQSCVVYQRTGSARTGAHGVSCFYPYSGSMERYDRYALGAAGMAMPAFCKQLLSADSGSSLETLAKELPYSVDENGFVRVTLPKPLLDVLRDVCIQVYSVDTAHSKLSSLGCTQSLTGDWETGELTADFSNRWGFLNGHIVYMEPVCAGEAYCTYHVPILLNGRASRLVVVYHVADGSYSVSGVAEGPESDSGGGRLKQLAPGDQVTTLTYVRSYKDNKPKQTENETFKLGEEIHFADAALPDGYYYIPLELTDFLNRRITVGSFVIQLKEGRGTVMDTLMEEQK